MNYKTMLLASAAALFATQANAVDITNPFYLPDQGDFLSVTRIEASRAHYEKNKVNLGHEKELYARETLMYGLSDNWSIYGELGNTFMYGNKDRTKNGDLTYNNDHNFDYALGTAYNMRSDRLLLQLHGAYMTFDPRSWYGKDVWEHNRWIKVLNAGVKLGYDAGCGFTPYTTFDVFGNIDDNDRGIAYSWFAGAHKQVENVAVDAGIRYDFTTDKGYYEGPNEEWNAKLDVDYYVRDNMTVGAYGSYYLGGEDHNYVDYDFTLGLALKAAF